MSDETPASAPTDGGGHGNNIPIVGIGASAGGIKALETLFESLPPGLGAAFVVIVHLDPHRRSELASILAAHTNLGVEQVNAPAKLKPDHVYVIPPDRQLRMSDHEIAAVPFDEPRGRRAPIDLFFRSLAEENGDSCAVILTGAGSDGAVGAKAIKEAGGILLVQDPEEAEYPSMPRSAIATHLADFVLPIRDLAQRLAELIRAKREAQRGTGVDEDETVLRRIIAILRSRTGHDFSHYKRSTVQRRVQRRMQVARIDSVSRYFAYLRSNLAESQALMSDLLISVTTFFRDPGSFEALAKEVIPRIFDHPDSGVVRVWIPGCATGEEAYSIAILLLEEAARREPRPDIQIFATDLDSNALAIAREGRYPAAIQADISEERLRRFFTGEGDYYSVKRELREIVLFANHSLLKDPPFSRLDLISCRNLLIYLDHEMQQQVLSTLHYGLNHAGYLFLGASESTEHALGYFHAIDREAKIFQSTGRRRDQLPTLPTRLVPSGGVQRAPAQEFRGAGLRGLQAVHWQALETAAPPSILVDVTWRVVHISETAGRYLQPQGGPLSADVTELVRPELRLELSAALHKAFERNEQTLSAAIFVRFNGNPHRTYIQIKPVATRGTEKSAQHALVLFIESGAEDLVVSNIAGEQPVDEDVRRLLQEMELMQGRLNTTREESETANEELRAANEELQSINEEYRSTAEELETSKEELQSINEELQTVNTELKLKLETVSRAHTDLQYLMAATDLGMLFLDRELKIHRFTPPLAELFSITETDIGRPITDFTHKLEYAGLSEDVQTVLHDLVPIEREIGSRSGRWYFLRFRPYRTADDRIEGVVVTFLDVTERRRMEDALRASEANLKQEVSLVELSRSPIFVWDFDDGILKWNRGSEELYGYTREEAQGRVLHELLRTRVPGGSFDAVCKTLLEKGAWKGELHQLSKDGRQLIVESDIELAVAGDGRRLVFESVRDATRSRSMDARQDLLVAELTHRVKNLLTVVQGMVHQSARNSTSVEDFTSKLDGRISALANSQKLLVDSVWEGTDFLRLVEQQLAPYLDDRRRVHIAGEPIVLPADLATPFGLVLHELATNAAKYGALSGDKGRVNLSWSMEKGNGGDLLKVVWEENDGPAVCQPRMAGFGSHLIEQGLPGATVNHDFLAEGIRCRIELPLPKREWIA